MKPALSDLVNNDTPTLIDFTAVWCGPCQTLAPILKDVKKSIGDAVTIIKIDVDANPRVAAQFQVRSVPTLILFKNGEAVWRQSGVMTHRDLLHTLQQHVRD
ncbi:MAG: thioredoxin [Candidatus Kapaibacterium sp.]